MWCVPALRVPLVHSLINHFRQIYGKVTSRNLPTCVHRSRLQSVLLGCSLQEIDPVLREHSSLSDTGEHLENTLYRIEHSSYASPHDACRPSPPRLQCRERPRTPHGSTSEAAAVGRARHAGPHECHCHLPLERARLHAQWPDFTQRPLIPRGLVPLPRLQSRDAADHRHCRCGPTSRVDPRSGTSGRLVRLSCSLSTSSHPPSNIL